MSASTDVRDELAKLRGRILGDCAACGHAVYFEHNFTRLNGRVIHVRCPIIWNDGVPRSQAAGVPR
jgi:hypothetical protein